MPSAMDLAGRSIGAILARPPLEPLETRILLGHVLGLSRVQLITRSEQILTAQEAHLLESLLSRRLDGEPIAYLTGEREFYGLPFAVTSAVLIPRPETELLVELAIEKLPSGGRAIDLGTGSGAIAVALARNRPDAQVTALDASEAALDVARGNAQRNGVQVGFLHSDWYRSLDEAGNTTFDLVVSNPPYIVSGDRHLSQGDLRFEPLDALTDHGDGLSALRTIIAGAPGHLAPGGWLLMEHGYDQAGAVRELLGAAGFGEVCSWCDLAGIERVSGGKR
ncbi:MAG: peptide chain release factor N(5)-glutamine methyltransferase [Noviherbaspirillum sp.]